MEGTAEVWKCKIFAGIGAIRLDHLRPRPRGVGDEERTMEGTSSHLAVGSAESRRQRDDDRSCWISSSGPRSGRVHGAFACRL